MFSFIHKSHLINHKSILLVIVFSFFVSCPVSAGTIFKAPSSLGLTSGLVGWWTFDGTDINVTKALDKSGNANHGTLTNGPKRVSGKLGQAIDFDGIDDAINAGSPTSLDNLTSMTVSAWVKPRSPGGGNVGRILTKYNWGFLIDDNSGNALTFYHETVGTELKVKAIDNSWSANKWQHVVMTTTGSFTATETHIYVNGVEVSYQEQQNGTGGSWNDDSSREVYIGNDLDLGNPVFDGVIDDVRLYNRALSTTEVKRLYNMGATALQFKTPSTSLTSGLLGWWTFDGANVNATQVKDISSSNITCTRTGSPRTTPGKLGQAMDFNGTTQYATCGDNLDFNRNDTRTFSAWINPDTIPGSSANFMILSKIDTNTPWPGWQFALYDGDGTSARLRFDYCIDCSVGGNLQNYSYTNRIISPSGGWYHVVGVLNSNEIVTWYVNGVLQSNASTQTLAGSNINTNIVLCIACDDNDTDELFDGQIDDVRLYNRALSATEVLQLYNQSAGSKLTTPTTSLTSGLVGWWTFDGPDVNATQARDKSGQGNHGTRTNGVTTIPGKIGQAMAFDGVDDYIDLGNAKFDLSTLTVCVWFKTRGLNGEDQRIVTSGSENTNDWGLLINQGTGDGQVSMTNTSSSHSTTLSNNRVDDNKWHFACGLNNPETLYIDGVLQTSSQTNSYSFDVNSKIGSRGSAQDFSGTIDDVRIYNRALSPSEVLQLYNQGR